MSKIVHAMNKANKRARQGQLTEEEELDAVMAAAEKFQRTI